jgi:hypothetical protein
MGAQPQAHASFRVVEEVVAVMLVPLALRVVFVVVVVKFW